MTRTWSPICISVLVLLPVACTNAGHERPIISSWEAYTVVLSFRIQF